MQTAVRHWYFHISIITLSVTVMAFSCHTTLGPKWVFPKRGLLHEVAPAISHHLSHASVSADISLSCFISLQEITTTHNMNYNFNYIVKWLFKNQNICFWWASLKWGKADSPVIKVQKSILILKAKQSTGFLVYFSTKDATVLPFLAMSAVISPARTPPTIFFPSIDCWLPLTPHHNPLVLKTDKPSCNSKKQVWKEISKAQAKLSY